MANQISLRRGTTQVTVAAEKIAASADQRCRTCLHPINGLAIVQRWDNAGTVRTSATHPQCDVWCGACKVR